jgi:hypothetical protein
MRAGAVTLSVDEVRLRELTTSGLEPAHVSRASCSVH